MAGPSRITDQVKDKAEDVKNKGHETASHAADKARDAASQLGQQAQDVAQRAQEAAANVGQKAQDLASTAVHKTDDALSTVGEKMGSLAGTLRERAPQEGMMGSAAGVVADQLQAGGQYLQEHGVQDMAGDLSALIHRYPLQSLFVGLGVGFLAGKMLSRR